MRATAPAAAWRLHGWPVLAVALVLSLVDATSHWGEPSPTWRALAAGALALYALNLASPRGLSLGRGTARRFTRLLFAFTVFSAASTVWSATPTRTLSQAGALALVVVIVSGSMVGRWGDERTVRRDAMAIYGLLGVVVLASLLWFALGFPTAVAPPRSRLQGILVNPNNLAMVCALILPLLAGMARRHRQWAILLAGPAVLALLLTESRTGIAASAIGVAVALVRGRVRARTLLAALVGTAAVLIALSAMAPLLPTPDRLPEPVIRVLERFDGSEGSFFATREGGWREAIELWRHEPLIGRGFRSGELLFQQQRAVGELGTFGPRDTAHSGFLQVLMESGLFGLALVAALLVVTVWPYRVAVSPTMAGLHGVVTAGWAMQATESHLFGMGAIFATVFWVSAGMLVRLVDLAGATPRQGTAQAPATTERTS